MPIGNFSAPALVSILDRPASGEVGLLSIIPIIHALPFLSYENVDILHFKCLIKEYSR